MSYSFGPSHIYIGEIDDFHGENFFLSNFSPSPVQYWSLWYPTVEHAYQAAKSDDWVTQKAIQLAETPGKAKRMGRMLKIRENWDNLKDQVMMNLLLQKFTDLELLDRLRATKPKYLREGNNWGDKYWGTVKCKEVDGFDVWVGQNKLGKMLMEIRDGK